MYNETYRVLDCGYSKDIAAIKEGLITETKRRIITKTRGFLTFNRFDENGNPIQVADGKYRSTERANLKMSRHELIDKCPRTPKAIGGVEYSIEEDEAHYFVTMVWKEEGLQVVLTPDVLEELFHKDYCISIESGSNVIQISDEITVLGSTA